jgi:hypothetical protein
MPGEEMPVDPISGGGAAEIIRLLDLHSHPEGGFFRETFRDPARGGRAVSTLTPWSPIFCARNPFKRGYALLAIRYLWN